MTVWRYVYYVVAAGTDSFVSMEVPMMSKITGIEQLERIAEHIQNKLGLPEKPTVTNYLLLREATTTSNSRLRPDRRGLHIVS